MDFLVDVWKQGGVHDGINREILMNPLPFVVVWIQFVGANKFTGAYPFLPCCQNPFG